MTSTADNLSACKRFGEAMEEWDLQSQHSDGPPTNEDSVRDTEQLDDQDGQRSKSVEQQRLQQPQPARQQHH